ncbi:SCO1/SenC protein [Cardiosporidium cionae]|uniref:SCO1/SenC protein n=1 Tax=Cardiosporidium cionae TaxID=476202 RepID=A0ABQ7JGH1_9APIC|nr:SCO1/SenC protein [Cardiosporidium cionae]|eukprot:KAF8823104.1 SCO1/SenC protein [Cardiosporidium cionae]
MWNRFVTFHCSKVNITPTCLLSSSCSHVRLGAKYYYSAVHNRFLWSARQTLFKAGDPLHIHYPNLKTFGIPICFNADRGRIFLMDSSGRAALMASTRYFCKKEASDKTVQRDSIDEGKIPTNERSVLPQISWKVAAATSLACWLMPPVCSCFLAKVKSTTVGKPKLGGPWTLVNQRGNLVSDSDLRGKYQLLYFGFSFCPDICPLELEKQSQVIEELDKIFGPVVQPIFVTVDPGRDTVAQVEAYCREFHPRLMGLTGTPEQIKQITRSFRVYYNESIRTDDDDYLVDHSIIQYLMGTNGKFKEFFGKNMTAAEMVFSFKKIIISDKLFHYRKFCVVVNIITTMCVFS